MATPEGISEGWEITADVFPQGGEISNGDGGSTGVSDEGYGG